jgi:hypothetical protein
MMTLSHHTKYAAVIRQDEVYPLELAYIVINGTGGNRIRRADRSRI